jgi:hypothetical protein
VHDYRTNVGLAAIAFAVAAAAGFVYGAAVDFVVLGFTLLAVALAWGALWLAAGRRSTSVAEMNITLVRASWIVGFGLAIVLFVSAIAAG